MATACDDPVAKEHSCTFVRKRRGCTELSQGIILLLLWPKFNVKDESVAMLLPTSIRRAALLKHIRFYYNQQRMKCFRKCTCRYLIMCVLLLILLAIAITVQVYRYSTSCSDNESRQYLEQIVGYVLLPALTTTTNQ